ncbi:MAG: hypothetical protein LBC14_06285 [Desulfovibrio sp.]|nr:hypothetical protein [Desulfovibrio sp.]
MSKLIFHSESIIYETYSSKRGIPVLRREVDALVHPMLNYAPEEFRTECDAQGLPFAVAEIPLYFETGGKRDKEDVVTVGVHCPFPTRRERLTRLRGRFGPRRNAGA